MPVIGKIDRTNKCYQSKDDKLHATIFYRGDLSQETAEQRAERLKNLHEFRGRWVWDNGKLVRAEDYYANQTEIDAPKVSSWQNEWTTLCCGKPMSKAELKRYCKENGKIWEN